MSRDYTCHIAPYLYKLDSLIIERDWRSPRRHAQDLLASCVDNVHPEFVHLEGSSTQRGDSVNRKEGAIAIKARKNFGWKCVAKQGRVEFRYVNAAPVYYTVFVFFWSYTTACNIPRWSSIQELTNLTAAWPQWLQLLTCHHGDMKLLPDWNY